MFNFLKSKPKNYGPFYGIIHTYYVEGIDWELVRLDSTNYKDARKELHAFLYNKQGTCKDASGQLITYDKDTETIIHIR